MTKKNSYLPEWASPPGDTIEDALEEKNLTQADLAERLGLSKKHVNELIKGKVALTPDVALRLENVLDTPAAFWLRREAQYREDLARLEAHRQAEANAGWLDELPVKEMVRLGWLKKSPSKGAQVLELLRFFGVANVQTWRERSATPALAFRASPSFEKSLGAVLVWKRKAELEASKAALARFDKTVLKASLKDLRGLTLEPEPEVFIPRLQKICAEAGVATVLLPAPRGCPVSGAAWFSGPERAVIALSLRHKSNDHLWFSFFHEVGHLLLHGKKEEFIDVPGLDGLVPEKEHEANDFAKKVLFTDEAGYRTLAASRRLSHAAVEAYARKIGIAPGIVVGRLQHEGVLPPTHLHSLKIRYKWT